MKFYSVILCVIFILDKTFGYSSAIPGKYQSHRNDQNDVEDQVEVRKMFFGSNSNRAPFHDTPASECSCSEFNKIKKINKKK